MLYWRVRERLLKEERGATVSGRWKRLVAHLVRWRPLQRLMVLGIRAIVARHRVGVALVAIDDQGRILLLHHVFHPYVPWDLPGGWLARGETPAACALRELKEETGLDASLGPVVHVARVETPPHLIVAYLADVQPGAMTLGPEIINADWFAPDDLPTPLLPFSREAIQAARRVNENGII